MCQLRWLFDFDGLGLEHLRPFWNMVSVSVTCGYHFVGRIFPLVYVRESSEDEPDVAVEECLVESLVVNERGPGIVECTCQFTGQHVRCLVVLIAVISHDQAFQLSVLTYVRIQEVQ